MEPLIIAHRGASGYLPEHTLEAKALAYGQGADYLEQDVVATRDGALVVLHDPWLERVTDVAERFPGRQRADGHYHVLDFDLAEVRQLTVRGRDGHAGVVHFRVATLEEELDLVQRLNRATGKKVGVYPEIKHPRMHHERGIDLARLLLEQLARFGYCGASDRAFVQCFDPAELRRVREELGSPLALIQLVEDTDAYAPLLTPAGLADLARYAQGLGPSHAQLVRASDSTGGWTREPLVERARRAGLLLHPYTFRRVGLPSYCSSLEDWLEIFLGEVGVDGVFCDFPDVGVEVRARTRGR